MRKLLLLPLLGLGLAACAGPDGQTDMCTTMRRAIAAAELNGFTSIDIGGRVITLDQAKANVAAFCPVEQPAGGETPPEGVIPG